MVVIYLVIGIGLFITACDLLRNGKSIKIVDLIWSFILFGVFWPVGFFTCVSLFVAEKFNK